MDKQAKHLYEFGGFRLDPLKHVLLCQGRVVPLPPKAFDTLVVLVQAGGRLLRKEELLRTIWADSFVEENNLTQCISLLRKTLAEGPGNSTYIETVPRLGYRFVAEVKCLADNESVVLLARHTTARVVVSEEVEEESTDGYVDDARPIVKAEASTRPSSSTARGMSSGRKKQLAAAVVVVIAVAAAALATALHFRRAPMLTERDQILLADFENSTGEPVFDEALNRALAVKLEESPFLNIISEQQARDTLRLMGRSADERLTVSLAREVCQRRGAQVLLSGSIAQLGSEYVISLEAMNCSNGAPLGRVQANAASRDQILPALGESASQLRGKLGESLSSIEKFDVPLEEATTSSLEALRAFSLGERLRSKGLQVEAIPFLQRAIELDPQFAIAYGRLAAVYVGIGEPDRARQYSGKAFELRNRCSAREKLILSASYYQTGIGDFEKTVSELEVWKLSYPRDFIPHVNLAALYNDAGQFDRAFEEGREGLRLNPGHALGYNNTGWAALRWGHVEDAKAIFEKAIAEKLDNTMMHRGLYAVAFLQGDASAMEREAGFSRGKSDEFRMVLFQAQAQAFSGRLHSAQQSFARSAELARKNHFDDAAAAALAGNALVEASFGRDLQAHASTMRALAIGHGRDAMGIAASAFALSGDRKRAQECMNELAKAYPNNTLVNAVALSSARAAIEIQLGNSAKAIEILKDAEPYEFGPFVFGQGYLPGYLRGQAYLSLGRGSQAAAEFQKIIDHRAAAPFAPLQALAHLGLARALASSHNWEKSRQAYQEFFLLWKDADPDIPVLQKAKIEFAHLS